MGRKFLVWRNSKAGTSDIIEFYVSDITDEESDRSAERVKKLEFSDRINYLHQELIRPRVATFPVSELHDEDTQRRRARMLADYLNKIQEAHDRAESENVLLDILASPKG